MKQDLDLETYFGLASIVTNYSFAAIEAFTNERLHVLWMYARTLHTVGMNVTIRLPYNEEKLKDFFDKYGHYESFRDLGNTDLRELEKKLNVIYDIEGLKRISEDNPPLWADFKMLLKESGHFLIHTEPLTGEFEEGHRELLDVEKLQNHIDIAQNVIEYFYTPTPERFQARGSS